MARTPGGASVDDVLAEYHRIPVHPLGVLHIRASDDALAALHMTTDDVAFAPVLCREISDALVSPCTSEVVSRLGDIFHTARMYDYIAYMMRRGHPWAGPIPPGVRCACVAFTLRQH